MTHSAIGSTVSHLREVLCLLCAAAAAVSCLFERTDILCFVLCVEGYFYLYVLKEFSNSPYLSAAVCKGDLFCFVMLRVLLCVLFLWGKGFSH
jgi:hypothetical protein